MTIAGIPFFHLGEDPNIRHAAYIMPVHRIQYACYLSLDAQRFCR
jgi:hypothetical protein